MEKETAFIELLSMLSLVQEPLHLWTVACLARLSMESLRQEY